jgi:hypothetical protein
MLWCAGVPSGVWPIMDDIVDDAAMRHRVGATRKNFHTGRAPPCWAPARPVWSSDSLMRTGRSERLRDLADVAARAALVS